MVAGELADLAGKADRPVGEQDLRLADPARVQQYLTRCREAGVVLVAEPEVEVAERDPARLAAPSHVNDALLVRQQAAELRAGLRGRVGLEPGAQDIGPGGDGDLVQAALLKWAWAGVPPRTGARSLTGKTAGVHRGARPHQIAAPPAHAQRPDPAPGSDRRDAAEARPWRDELSRFGQAERARGDHHRRR